ncbi:uncharacterized protein LOC134837683 [Culicoides brevitarsis]|uniref:uncharacterized protein LOC134837683 n=1 Tax=Culicoides brevitarsis TaxID=469753 RepID=UPI00307B2861
MVSFDRIWKLIQESDITFGSFLFTKEAQVKSPSVIVKLLKLQTPLNAFLIAFGMISTVVMTNFNITSVIFCLTVSVTSCGFFLSYWILIISRQGIKDLLEWCRKLYDVNRKFQGEVKVIAENRLVQTEAFTVKVFKWIRNLLLFNGIFCCTGGSIISFFLPDDIVPKFEIPVPFMLPFPDQHTWICFITSVVVCQIALVYIALGIIFLSFLFLCITLHILGFCDVILESIEEMKNDLEARTEEIRESYAETSTALPFLRQKVPLNDKKFENWIKCITSMIVDVNTVILKMYRIFTYLALIIEIVSLSNLFLTGLIIIIVKSQYFFAVSGNVCLVILFGTCYINEVIRDKFDEIEEALYDLPWYAIDVKHQKILLVMLQCDKIQLGLTAAGIHEMTIERFGTVLQAGYSNLLVLKDFIHRFT